MKLIDVNELINSDSSLTGKFRFRTTIFGKLILQVEYVYHDVSSDSSMKRSNFRDAKVEDLTLLEPNN